MESTSDMPDKQITFRPNALSLGQLLSILLVFLVISFIGYSLTVTIGFKFFSFEGMTAKNIVIEILAIGIYVALLLLLLTGIRNQRKIILDGQSLQISYRYTPGRNMQIDWSHCIGYFPYLLRTGGRGRTTLQGIVLAFDVTSPFETLSITNFMDGKSMDEVKGILESKKIPNFNPDPEKYDITRQTVFTGPVTLAKLAFKTKA